MAVLRRPAAEDLSAAIEPTPVFMAFMAFVSIGSGK
jgi:hypothetical protein